MPRIKKLLLKPTVYWRALPDRRKHSTLNQFADLVGALGFGHIRHSALQIAGLGDTGAGRGQQHPLFH